jgi:hypothetical protein
MRTLRLKRKALIYIKRDLRDIEPLALVMMGLIVAAGIVITILA